MKETNEYILIILELLKLIIIADLNIIYITARNLSKIASISLGPGHASG
jgi:hypothetical protein